MANNKQIGAEFERQFVEILAKEGFWVHFLAPSPTGAQPFDVIAMKDGYAYCFDCKTSVKPIFPLSRLEDNQILAFDKWLQCGGCTPFVAVKYDDKINLVEYTRLQREGSVDLRTEEVWRGGREMTSLERYRARRAAGLCYMCGEPSGDKCTCDKCSEYIRGKNKAIYNYRAQIGLCTKCGKEPAAEGRKICDKCREYNKQHPPKQPATKEERHEYYIARRAKQKAGNICYICNAAPADSGKKSCAKCREKKRLQKNTQGGMKRIERLDNDLCWLCGEPVWGMYNVCEKHYNMLLHNLGKSKEGTDGNMGK